LTKDLTKSEDLRIMSGGLLSTENQGETKD